MNAPTIEFCEGIHMNQSITKYVNEFGNTFSALFFSYLAISLFFRPDSRKYARMMSTIVLTFCVGIGSALFHATGSRFYQYFDEIPMILMLSEVISKVQEENYLQKTYSLKTYKTLTFLNEYIKLSAITTNCLSDNFNIFKNLYMFLIFLTSLNIYIAVNKKYRRFVSYTIFEGFIGYFFWILDYNFCNKYTGFINFHFWWHIFMGIVAHNMIELFVVISYTRRKLPIIIDSKNGMINTKILPKS